jgi:two-component system response regulator NreC
LLADDHPALREGLAMLIQAQADMEVVGQASTGPAAVEIAGRERPDVAVMDLSMPGGSGIEAIAKLRELSPETRVVVLTMHDDPAHLRSVLAVGASGFIAKHMPVDQLLTAVREVHAGRSSISVNLEQSSLAELFDAPRDASSAPELVLSKRECEVLRLVAEGFSNSQIGEKLGVSKKSVDTYRVRVSQKLGLRNRAELVRYALDSGVLHSARRGRE